MKNESNLRKDFWNTINNQKKVSINLLSDDDVETYEVGDNKDVVMVIYVPMAKREQKPVTIRASAFALLRRERAVLLCASSTAVAVPLPWWRRCDEDAIS